MLQAYSKKKNFFFFLNLIKSAKITNYMFWYKSMCFCAMNISLVVIRTVLRWQWSLQLSVTSATSDMIFLNASVPYILTRNGIKYK